MTQGHACCMHTSLINCQLTRMQGPGRPQMRQRRVVNYILRPHRLVHGDSRYVGELMGAGCQGDGLIDRRGGQEALMCDAQRPCPNQSIDQPEPYRLNGDPARTHIFKTYLILDVECHQVPVLQPVVRVGGSPTGRATPAAAPSSYGPSDASHSQKNPAPVQSHCCVVVCAWRW